MSSSSAVSQSGMACCSCSMSEASISCLRASIWPRRKWSRARRLAVAISHAPGLSGTPVAGQCSSAASSASSVRSSASGTSRSIRARLVISRGCLIRQTARIVRSMPAAVMAAGYPGRFLASRAGKRANLARSVPTRHVILVELHELDGRRYGFFLVPQLENGIAADDLLGLHERAIDHAEIAIRDAHLGAGGNRHQPAAVEHAAGLDLPVSELVHRLHQFRRRRPGVGGIDYEHEAHLRNSWLERAVGTIAAKLARLLSRRTSRPQIDMRFAKNAA